MNFQDLLVGRGGYFKNRLKYLRDKCSIADRMEQITISENVSNPEEDLLFLKNCVVKNIERQIIIDKLNSTRKHRKEMLRAPETDIRTSFPFFLSNPELVCIEKYIETSEYFVRDCNSTELSNILQICLDFAHEFKNVKAMALIINWPQYAPKIRDHMNNTFSTIWSSNIEEILYLLYLFLSKSSNNQLPFFDAISKLIIFRVVSRTILS